MKTYDRQNPALYMLLIMLGLMAVGPIYLMLATSLKLNLDIMSDASSLIFMPRLRNYKTVCATSCGAHPNICAAAIPHSGVR